MTSIGNTANPLDLGHHSDACLRIYRSLARGQGPIPGPRLSPEAVLVWICLLALFLSRPKADRAKPMRVRPNLIARRCEIHRATPNEVLAPLAAAGLLQIVEEASPGRAAKILIVLAPKNGYLLLPNATIWRTDAVDCPPYWGERSPRAVQGLLAILNCTDFKTGLVSDDGETPLTSQQIANRAALSRSVYNEDITLIVGPGPKPGQSRTRPRATEHGWLSITPVTVARWTEDGPEVLQDASRIQVDWTLLPPQSPSLPVQEDPAPSPFAWLLTASQQDVEAAFKEALDKVGGDPEALDDADWTTLPFASLLWSPHRPGHAVRLTADDLDALAPLVLKRRGEWTAAALADHLTRRNANGITHPAKAVQARLKALDATPPPSEPFVDGIWAPPLPSPPPPSTGRRSGTHGGVYSAQRITDGYDVSRATF